MFRHILILPSAKKNLTQNMKTYEEFYSIFSLLKSNKWTLKISFRSHPFNYTNDLYLGIRTPWDEEALKKLYDIIQSSNDVLSISLQTNERITSPWKNLFSNNIKPINGSEISDVMNTILSNLVLDSI